MFKLHKPQLSGSIHSGHFMVSRLDDDDDDQNDAGDDSSESERDNAQSVEIDVNNPESVADAAKNIGISYQVQSPSAKSELVTDWNDLDRPAKRAHKPHQYLTYYTNSSSNFKTEERRRAAAAAAGVTVASGSGASGAAATAGIDLVGSADLDDPSALMPMDATIPRPAIQPVDGSTTSRSGAAANRQPGSMLDQVAPNSISGLMAAAAAAAASASATGEASAANLRQAPPPGASSSAGGSLAVGTCSPDATTYLVEADKPRDLSSASLQQVQQMAGSTQDLPGQHQVVSASEVACAHAHAHAHAVTIDTSLTKLLECMSLYYSSKLTSPKWKSFKGLKLRMKHKIRLNNLIWRAWFLQCIRGRRPPGCQFTAPAETDVHKKDETIVLEGKYWKRKEKAIADEYKKWRTFHKQRSQGHYFRPSSFDWDSRASNLVSCGPDEYGFYPDYDMNLNYNLDELPPMLEELENCEQEGYYQASLPLSSENAATTVSQTTAPVAAGAGTSHLQPVPQQQPQSPVSHQAQQLSLTLATSQQATTIPVPAQQQPQQHSPHQPSFQVAQSLHQQHVQFVNQMQLSSRLVGEHSLQQPHQQQQQRHQTHQSQLQHQPLPHHLMNQQQQQQSPHQPSHQLTQSLHQQQLQYVNQMQLSNRPVGDHSLQQPHQQSHQRLQTHQAQMQHQQLPHHLSLGQQQQQQQHLQDQHAQHQHQQQHQQPGLLYGNQQHHGLHQLQQQQHHHHHHPMGAQVGMQTQQHHLQQQQQQQLLTQQQEEEEEEAQQAQEQLNYMNQDLMSVSSNASGSSLMSGLGGGIGGGGAREEQRRVCHINAEQKRRCNIKNGFDTLRSLLPSVNQNVNVKVSKASMLQKAAVHISNLSSEQKQQLDEQAILRKQIEQLRQSIRNYQMQLPAAGVGGPGAGAGSNPANAARARETFQAYVRRRTLENWKFWIFSYVIEPLYETYYNTVNTNSLEDACKTIYTWLDQNCGMYSLRNDATDSLTLLGTRTNVLTSPHTLPSEAMAAAAAAVAVTATTATTTTTNSSSSSCSTSSAAPTTSGVSALLAREKSERQ